MVRWSLPIEVLMVVISHPVVEQVRLSEDETKQESIRGTGHD
jgi:hypothetical protein